MKQQLIEALMGVLDSVTEEQAQVIIEARAKKYNRPEFMPNNPEVVNDEPKHLFFMRSIFDEFNTDALEYVDAMAREEAEAELSRIAKEKAESAFTPVNI